MNEDNFLTRRLLKLLDENYKFVLASYSNGNFNGFSRKMITSLFTNCLVIQNVRDVDCSFKRSMNDKITAKIFIIPKNIQLLKYKKYIIDNIFTLPKLQDYLKKIHLCLNRYYLSYELIDKIINIVLNNNNNQIWELINIGLNVDNTMRVETSWYKFMFSWIRKVENDDLYISHPHLELLPNNN